MLCKNARFVSFNVIMLPGRPGSIHVKHFTGFKPNFFTYVYTIFFQPIAIGISTLRRFYSSHILAKTHTLGVTGFFL